MADNNLIFRIFTGGSATNTDWHGSRQFPYDDKNRDNIQVGNGDKLTDEITSIPSPFARIDIAKNAFKEVNKRGVDGNSIFHKTVSDILDVGEIFFNYDKLKDKIQIVKWDPQNITKLKNSPSIGNKYLGIALDNYLKSDAATYNFSSTQNIYILQYIYGKSSMEVIGATSPSTVFFSSANDLSYLSKIISFGQDHPFDNDLCPLYKRDPDYIRAWCVFRKLVPNFAAKMPEVNEYLDKTLAKIEDVNLRAQLFNVTSADYKDYLSISANNNTVEVFGVNLLMKVVKPVGDSDFTINPTNNVVDKPLVLPCEKGNTYEDFKYTTSAWGRENRAHYVEERPMGGRTLPYDGRKQDYLTISDFLEDYLIMVPHKLNGDDYVKVMSFQDEKDGEEISYLLPLKETFFKYFSAEDLASPYEENKLGIKMEKMGEGVNVKLQIPVKGHGRIKTITYERLYSGDANIKNNSGGIESFDFAAFVMPLVRDKDASHAFYTVGCTSTKNRDYSFKFFKGEKAVQAEKSCRNENSQLQYKTLSYSIHGADFDYIQVSNSDGLKGIIVPKFRRNSESANFDFSIDIGTSNTHIAYTKNGSTKIEDFNIEEGEKFSCPVFIPTIRTVSGTEYKQGLDIEKSYIFKDFLPDVIGENSNYKFPTRTVLTIGKNFKLGQASEPYGMYNASLTYDKDIQLDYNRDLCNIKWDKDESALKDYVSCILLMIRYKILANDGDLSKTNITWFYPTSMPTKRLTVLQNIWKEMFDKYFGTGACHYMTESSAPIYYLFYNETNSSDITSIDIGGGTTDIAISKQKKILSVSSFRFASNDMFKNALAPYSANNGIVDYFKKVIYQNIVDNDKSDEHQLVEQMTPLFNSETHSDPANMASFLFSLKENTTLRLPQYKINTDVVDFNLLLNRDENFKIVFILFYAAIIYHVGKIIKYEGYNLPGLISFSGNGSKLLNVITTNPDNLAAFTKIILESVTGKTYASQLKIVGLSRESDPKKTTCKGGLKVKANVVEEEPVVALRADGTGELSGKMTLEDIRNDESYKKMVVNAAKEFFDLLLRDIPEKFDYDEHFGVTEDSMMIARDYMNHESFADNLSKSIELLIEDEGEKEHVAQTMFFAPIKGALSSITEQIYNSLQSKMGD